jgi:arsenate reductase-like glutaredoxin family protein
LDANGIEPAETVLASKKLGKADAARMAREASKVVVSKGKKVTEFKPGGKASADLVAAMLGPTGNLRAPTARAGKLLLVGYNEDAYSNALL